MSPRNTTIFDVPGFGATLPTQLASLDQFWSVSLVQFQVNVVVGSPEGGAVGEGTAIVVELPLVPLAL